MHDGVLALGNSADRLNQIVREYRDTYGSRARNPNFLGKPLVRKTAGPAFRLYQQKDSAGAAELLSL
ncbi:hypothetical protein IAE55_09330 [Paenibacillus sp. S28]|nr:hypothetical protein [Paenibacillus sp. S28]PQP91273.1 hypothetical protein CPT76_01715 [Paenibacillus sp. AR247]